MSKSLIQIMAEQRTTAEMTVDDLDNGDFEAAYDIMVENARTVDKQVAALEAELAELRAVVEKLPKTADGVPCWVGMRVWPELLHDDEITGPDEGGIVTRIDSDGEIVIKDSQGEKGPNFVDVHVSNVYSTREAVLEAECPNCGTKKRREQTCPNPECRRFPETIVTALAATGAQTNAEERR